MAIFRRRMPLGITTTSNKRPSPWLPTRQHKTNKKKRKLNKDDQDRHEVDDPTSSAWSTMTSSTAAATTFIIGSDMLLSSSPSHTTDRSKTVVTPPPPLSSSSSSSFVKAVHFDWDNDDQEYECPHDKDFLKQHKADLWYPKTHRQDQQQEANKILATFKKEQAETVERFAALYRKVADQGHQDEDEDAHSSSTTEDTTKTKTVLSLPLEMRGLEWGITPQLKARRRKHIRQVLGCADMSLPESFQQVMRHSTSVNSSQAAVAMAQWYAKSDHRGGDNDDDDDNDDDNGSSAGAKLVLAVPAKPLLQSCALEAVSKELPTRQTLQSKRMCLWQRT